MKIVEAEIVDDGEFIHIKLEGAPDGYQWVFFSAEDLPQLADMSSDMA